MARPLRIHFENAYYHVMNRGRGRQRTFRHAADYQAFLDILAEAHERFGLHIHAYCLMGNHYHLLVHTPRGNLAQCMRNVNGLYTQRYNRLHGSVAILVESGSIVWPCCGVALPRSQHHPCSGAPYGTPSLSLNQGRQGQPLV